MKKFVINGEVKTVIKYKFQNATEYTDKRLFATEEEAIAECDKLNNPVSEEGLLVTFPFKELAQELGREYTTDILGRKMKIKDIDVFLTISQWKNHALYDDDFQIYERNMDNVIWGVQRVSPKRDKDNVKLNYGLRMFLSLVIVYWLAKIATFLFDELHFAIRVFINNHKRRK